MSTTRTEMPAGDFLPYKAFGFRVDFDIHSGLLRLAFSSSVQGYKAACHGFQVSSAAAPKNSQQRPQTEAAGIVGLASVGLLLAVEFAKAGFS